MAGSSFAGRSKTRSFDLLWFGCYDSMRHSEVERRATQAKGFAFGPVGCGCVSDCVGRKILLVVFFRGEFPWGSQGSGTKRGHAWEREGVEYGTHSGLRSHQL